MAGVEDGTELSFAERMMKNMGWSQGKGLGKQEEGMKDFIKPKTKFNTKGIGFMGVDNKWIAHQEHFDDLLTSLNKGEKPPQQKDIACLTSDSKLRGRTKFYAKMMRGKDLSNRSSQDLSAIIVPLSKKEKTSKPETAPLPSELDGTLKSSQVSMNDYFAKMMEQRKSKLTDGGSPTLTTAQDESGDESEKLAKKERKRKAKARDASPNESEPPCYPQPVEAEPGNPKKKKRRSIKADSLEVVETLEGDHTVVECAGVIQENRPKRKSKKYKDSLVVHAEECEVGTTGKKPKKSKKRQLSENLVEEAPEETHNDNAPLKEKKKRKGRDDRHQEDLSVHEDETAAIANNNSVQSGTSKRKKSKLSSLEDNVEISEDGTRLNVDVNLLKEIRGSKLRKSKAPPLRKLSDDQIQEIHRLWTSGEYAEFMRRVHSGELPRWVAVEKAQVDKMILGRAKLIDLADVREVVQTKWKSANVDEIWGYTNVAYLVV